MTVSLCDLHFVNVLESHDCKFGFQVHEIHPFKCQFSGQPKSIVMVKQGKVRERRSCSSAEELSYVIFSDILVVGPNSLSGTLPFSLSVLDLLSVLAGLAGCSCWLKPSGGYILQTYTTGNLQHFPFII